MSFSLVPIYDGRKLRDIGDLSEVLDNLHTLKAYKGGDLPSGSMAIVGYTVNKRSKMDTACTVDFNIQWVMGLGA